MCVCMCGLKHPACNAHAPYCHMWPVRFDNIFSTLFINSKIFEKKVIGHKMCVLIFSTTPFFFAEPFLVLRIAERDMIKFYICI